MFVTCILDLVCGHVSLYVFNQSFSIFIFYFGDEKPFSLIFSISLPFVEILFGLITCVLGSVCGHVWLFMYLIIVFLTVFSIFAMSNSFILFFQFPRRLPFFFSYSSTGDLICGHVLLRVFNQSFPVSKFDFFTLSSSLIFNLSISSSTVSFFFSYFSTGDLIYGPVLL